MWADGTVSRLRNRWAKSGSKLHALQTLARWRSGPEFAKRFEFVRLVGAFVGQLLLAVLSGASLQAQSPSAATTTNITADFFPIDLSRFVTTVFSNVPQGNMWSYLPRGQQTFQGVPFKVDGKLEVTGMDALHISTFFPARVIGIPVGRKTEKLVLLHGTGWTEKDGTPMAKIVLHYANGEEES